MIDPVLNVLEARRRLDQGFPRSLALSGSAHGLAFVAFALGVLLAPAPRLIAVVDGFAVQIPRGGGGPPVPQPPAQPLATPQPEAEKLPPPKATPPPLLKPEKARDKKGLTPNLKATEKKPTPTPSAAKVARGAPPTPAARETPAPAVEAGLALAPSGPGAPTGTDALGDLYLGGVQRRIWSRWQAELRSDTHEPVTVAFVILASGEVQDVAIARSSGSSLIDRAAQRAVLSAGPFAPLPSSLGKDRYLVHATFRPIG